MIYTWGPFAPPTTPSTGPSLEFGCSLKYFIRLLTLSTRPAIWLYSNNKIMKNNKLKLIMFFNYDSYEIVAIAFIVTGILIQSLYNSSTTTNNESLINTLPNSDPILNINKLV